MDGKLQEGSAASNGETRRVPRKESVTQSAELDRGLRLNREHQRRSQDLEKELLALIRAGRPIPSSPDGQLQSDIATASAEGLGLERVGLQDSLAELGRQVEVTKRGVCRPDSAMELRPRDSREDVVAARDAARASRLILGPLVGGTEAAVLAASGGNQALADQAASLALDTLIARGLSGPRLGAEIAARPPRFEVGVSLYEGNTVSVFRKMSSVEAQKTLVTSRLQPPERGANSSKYLSESLDKVEAFQNKGVKQGTHEGIVEFVMDRKGYEKLLSTRVEQFGSKGKDAVKIHREGINEDDAALRNIGVPTSKLDEFNKVVVKVWKLR